MRKISEVSRIVGVSRRTLQGFDEIGLLKPSTKTEAGYRDVEKPGEKTGRRVSPIGIVFV